MEQLSIAVSSDSGADLLFNRLISAFQWGKTGNQIEITRRDQHCFDLRLLSTQDCHCESWKLEVAPFISLYILDHMESEILKRLINQQHKPYTENEVEEILKFCMHLLNETDTGTVDSKQTRKTKIDNELSVYLYSNSSLHIDGFVKFRLKKYLEDLQDIVEYALDEFLLNQQYQEFIALLKYFVYFQDSKIPEVHLIHQSSNKFQLLDGSLKPLDQNDPESLVVETVDRELNYEDMVVSALISASPEQIHIHTRQPKTQSITTIQQIFEGRTMICTCCNICKPSLGERKAELT
jgi:putative sporulation protein YtxC